MANKVQINVEFIDSGNSAAKIASALSASVSKSKLSEGIKQQTEGVVAQLQKYASNIKNLKSGDLVDRKMFSAIFTESKQAQKSVTALVKAIKEEIKTLTLSDEVTAQINEVEAKLNQSESNQLKRRKKY